jgi:predicted RNA methylase
MAKSKKSGLQVEQLGFDFEFNETIETIGRIQTDASRDDDIHEGEQHAGRTNDATAGRGQATAELINAAGSGADAVHAPGLGNIGSLGNEFAGTASEPGEAGRSGVVEPVAATTELGATDAGSAGRIGNGDGGIDGTRNPDNAPDRNRAEVRAGNYVITDADRLGTGGARAKYRDNIAALSLLKKLDSEGRSATAEEQAVLVRYVGWGGIPQAFDHRNEEWRAEYQELAQLLSKDDYEAARRSTQDAHYTAQPVVEAIYSGLQRIGFDGGRMLEPAMGTGNFLGLMPQAMRDASKVTGIELDPATASIAKHLYPDSTVINRGYQDVAIPSGYFDLAVGNPPFGNQSIFDAEHRELSEFSIHNYFIGKTLDKVRDGGVVAVVVSNFFMDAQNSTAREWIADRAHLLGAMRLPNTAFKENALTEVTTDCAHD